MKEVKLENEFTNEDLQSRSPIPAESLKSRYPSPGHPSRLEGLVWIRLGFSSDFPQELGLYA